MHRVKREHRGERGAALILALVFMIVGVVIVGSLTYAVSNDLHNSSSFKTSRLTTYAATSVTNLALQSMRYSPLLSVNQTLNASPPRYCWGGGPISQLTGQADLPDMSVFCSTAWNPTSSNTRVVTITACATTGASAKAAGTACAAHPLLQAVVIFDDYPPGISSPTTAQCVVYCGTTMTIASWVFSPVAPKVTALSVTGGPVTGGTPLTITGTGFESGSVVNFIEENNGTPTSDNVVLPGTNVNVVNATTITANAPPVSTGTTYFVSVVTHSGASADNVNAVFAYSDVVPTVTSLNNSSGSTAGGTSLTITGTGFVSGAVVQFVQESGGTIVVPNVTVNATSVTVSSPTQITVITPSVTIATSYYVQVVTASGPSSVGPGDIFSFSPLVPTVASISPSNGPAAGGTSIVITGTGFVAGATVHLVRESGGAPVFPGVSLTATSVVVVGASTITAVTPAGTSGATYFVTVTTPTGTSNFYPVFTYV